MNALAAEFRPWVLLVALAVLVSVAPADEGSEGRWIGDWSGALVLGQTRIPIVLHVRESAGDLTATLDSPDQGAFEIPTTRFLVTADSLVFAVRGLGASYEGALDSSGTLRGSFRQGGLRLVLDLDRDDDVASSRPQDPVCPCPYDEVEVRFASLDPAVELAGTLTLPREVSLVAGVVLIAGSGSQDRDGSVFGHRPFRVLADRLAREGLAVLRVDERGVGSSSGDRAAATIATFVDDATAAFGFLRDRFEVDGSAVGILGHSEGGLIAVDVAVRAPGVDFVVLLGTPGIPGREILAAQTRETMRALDLEPGVVDAWVRTNRELTGLVIDGADSLEAELDRILSIAVDELDPAVAASIFGAPGPDRRDRLDTAVATLLSPWMREYLRRDPATSLRALRVPVLALAGSLDRQVDPSTNLAAIETALREAPVPFFSTHVVPGANHFFQTATTGTVDEYAMIEETLSVAVMDSIANWIARTVVR